MANYQLLKADIDEKVYQNGAQEITGENLNSVLNEMVTTLGAGYQFIGVATPTNPGTAQTPDYKCFYLATTPGTYTYLGGLVVADGEVAILKYDTSWTKELTGIATAESVSQLGQKIVSTTGLLDETYSISNNTWTVIGEKLNIKSGEEFIIKLKSNENWTRVIIGYSDNPYGHRIFDKTYTWYEDDLHFVATEDIDELWVYFSVSQTATINIKLEYGSYYQLKKLYDNFSFLRDKKIPNLESYIVTNNLFSRGVYSEGSWDKGHKNNSSYCYIAMIPIEAKTYRIIPRARFICTYDYDMKLVDYISQDNITSFTSTTVGYAFITLYKSDSIESYKLTDDADIAWENVYTYLFVSPTKKVNRLTNKLIYNFGDSIAAGDGNSGKGYAEILAENNNMRCRDYAVGGATLSKIEGQKMGCILDQINDASSVQPDVIIIDGGANDYTQSRQMGEMTQIRYVEITQWNYDTSTFLGALEQAFYLLRHKYPSIPIIFVYIHQNNSRWQKEIEGGEILSFYTMHDKALEVCRKWAVKVCDVFTEGQLNTNLTYQREHYTNNGDGTHPTQEGYEMSYIPLLKSKVDECIRI